MSAKPDSSGAFYCSHNADTLGRKTVVKGTDGVGISLSALWIRLPCIGSVDEGRPLDLCYPLLQRRPPLYIYATDVINFQIKIK